MEEKSLPMILIVDDETVLRDSLRAWLEDDGFDVLTAENGMEGLKILEQNQVDAAVLDIKMPGMDGVTLLDKIKKSQSELPVIMITAYATVDNAVKSMKQGAYDFITKPFPPEKLSVTLRRVIEHQNLLKENLRLKKERRQILHIAISAIITFSLVAIALYFFFGR